MRIVHNESAPNLITVLPTLMMTDCLDENALMVMVRDRLVAIFVALDDTCHGDLCGSWYREAGFGPCARIVPPPFSTLADALRWVARCAGLEVDQVEEEIGDLDRRFGPRACRAVDRAQP